MQSHGPDRHVANTLLLSSKFLSVFPRYLTPICTDAMPISRLHFFARESEREGSLSLGCALCPVDLNTLVYLVGAANVEGLFVFVKHVDATVGSFFRVGKVSGGQALSLSSNGSIWDRINRSSSFISTNVGLHATLPTSGNISAG